MPTSELYSITQAAKKIGVTPNTVYRWIRTELIPCHRNERDHRCLDEATVQELAALRQTNPGKGLEATQEIRKLEAVPIGTAADRIGLNKSTIRGWACKGLLAGVIHIGHEQCLPEALVDELAAINQELSFGEAQALLRISERLVILWIRNGWIRNWTLPGGIKRYSRQDVTFWANQMQEPLKNSVKRILRAPEAVIDELCAHQKGRPLSETAQKLINAAPSGLLRTALTYRRWLSTLKNADGSYIH